MDEIVDHYPEACGGCGARVRTRAAAAGWPVRSPSDCRAAADQRGLQRASHAPVALSALPRADQRQLAGEIAGSPFGPRLQAALVTLTAAYRSPRRGISETRSRSVRGEALDRRGRRDLPACRRRVGRPAPAPRRSGACTRRRCMSMRPAGERAAMRALCGPRTPTARCSCRSPSTATARPSTR